MDKWLIYAGYDPDTGDPRLFRYQVVKDYGAQGVKIRLHKRNGGGIAFYPQEELATWTQ